MLFEKNSSIGSLLRLPFQHTLYSSCLLILQRIVNACIPMLMLVVTARFIDAAVTIFNERRDLESVYISLALLIVLIAVQMLSDAVIGFVAKRQDMRLSGFIKLECLERQALLSYKHIDNRESYLFMERVVQELPGIVSQLFKHLLDTISMVIRLAGLLIIFMYYHLLWLSVAFLVVSAPMVMLIYRNGVQIYTFYKENFQGKLEMYHSTYILKDRSLSDERTLFRFTPAIHEQWEEMQRDLLQKKTRMNNKILLLRYTTKFLNLAAAFAIIGGMTFYIIEGRISLGAYIAMTTNLLALVHYIMENILSLANDISQKKEYIKDLNQFSSFETDEEALMEPASTIPDIETLEFRNVSFQYPGAERMVLRNVSFTIERNQRYAFVGKNGAGKSTIMKLLTKLYSDYDGEILVNGRSLKEYKYSEIKAFIGMIHQDFAKYGLSLADNINIGNVNGLTKQAMLDRTRHRITSEIGLQSLLSKLPQGEQTHLGKLETGGQNISGGEWQKVALSRLLMHGAPVLILDEPAASLDPRAENEVYHLFNRVSEGKTTIWISHRMGSVRMADCIFVLDHGEIVESGSHEELMQNGKLYSAMYNEQRAWYI